MEPEALIANIKSEILNPALILLFAIAMLVFIYGVWESIRDASSDKGRTQGKQHMLWGIIGMAIMVSAFGLVNVVCGTVGCEKPIVRPE